jgi:hypothetical protein
MSITWGLNLKTRGNAGYMMTVRLLTGCNRKIAKRPLVGHLLGYVLQRVQLNEDAIKSGGGTFGSISTR